MKKDRAKTYLWGKPPLCDLKHIHDSNQWISLRTNTPFMSLCFEDFWLTESWNHLFCSKILQVHSGNWKSLQVLKEDSK